MTHLSISSRSRPIMRATGVTALVLAAGVFLVPPLWNDRSGYTDITLDSDPDSDQRIHMGAGDDIAHGRGGTDELRGEDGDDALYGGEGNDVVWGGTGSDILSGGPGNDTFDFMTGDGQDKIIDFQSTATPPTPEMLQKIGEMALQGRRAELDALWQILQYNDVIDFSDTVSITDYRDLIDNHMRQAGSNVMIDALDGDMILIENMILDRLSEKNFKFYNPKHSRRVRQPS